MTIRGFILAVGGLINKSLFLVVGIALLVFLFGVAKFVFKASDEKSHEEGRRFMIWGVVALFVMFGIWGIINILRINLGLAYPPVEYPSQYQPTCGGLVHPFGGGCVEEQPTS